MVLTQTISSWEKTWQEVNGFLFSCRYLDFSRSDKSLIFDTLVLFYYYYMEFLGRTKKNNHKIFYIYEFFSSSSVYMDLEDTLYNSTAKNNILSQKCFIQLCNFVWFANMHEFSIKNNDYHNFWGHILMCVHNKIKIFQKWISKIGWK